MFNFEVATTNELVTIDRVNTAIVDLLIGNLREQYPHDMHEFFFLRCRKGRILNMLPRTA